MSKNTKTTVTVGIGWVSSNPTFGEFLAAVYRDLGEQKFFSQGNVMMLQGLIPLNGGKPFTGETRFGPHTWITIETPSLSTAIEIVGLLESFLKHEFSKVNHFCGGFHSVTYAGTALECVIENLETALRDAQPDLRASRWFFPKKSLQRLRLAFKELYK